MGKDIIRKYPFTRAIVTYRTKDGKTVEEYFTFDKHVSKEKAIEKIELQGYKNVEIKAYELLYSVYVLSYDDFMLFAQYDGIVKKR